VSGSGQVAAGLPAPGAAVGLLDADDRLVLCRPSRRARGGPW